jgi:hypothetical protein
LPYLGTWRTIVDLAAFASALLPADRSAAPTVEEPDAQFIARRATDNHL